MGRIANLVNIVRGHSHYCPRLRYRRHAHTHAWVIDLTTNAVHATATCKACGIRQTYAYDRNGAYQVIDNQR